MLKKYQFKYIFSAFLAGITATSILGAFRGGKIAQAQSKPQIVVSHNIICDLVATIAQDNIDLTCLIDANQDPHTYRPTPSQRKAIAEAQLILYGGYKLEPRVVSLLTDENIPKIAVYEQVVTEPIRAEHHHSESEHEDHHSESEHEDHHSESEHEDHHSELEPDPHVWHNIENTVKMVELIKAVLLQINPQAAEQYLVNSADLTEQLWQLEAWVKNQLDTIPEGQRILVTTHDSFNYYVQAYLLEDYLTLQGLSTESAPTASQVRELSQQIKQTEVSTIFVESTKSDRVIQNVARAADVELAPEPLYADGLGGATNYIEMMSHNTCAIVNGLGGECKPFN